MKLKNNISTINNLDKILAHCYASESVYKALAKMKKGDIDQSIIFQNFRERKRFVNQLQSDIHRLHNQTLEELDLIEETPENWKRLKQNPKSFTEDEYIHQCLKADQSLLQIYDRVLDSLTEHPRIKEKISAQRDLVNRSMLRLNMVVNHS